MSFHILGLSKTLLDTLTAIGYEHPTPVQEQVIPTILKGRSVFVTAKTGSGKSGAFLLPLLQLMQPQEGFLHVKLLVLVPTRELARQIHESVLKYGANLGFRSLMVQGGVNINPQVEALKNGVDILVATPGRLNDLLKLKAVVLSRVEHLVLDEADTMLDMGFLSELESLFEAMTQPKQTLLFSATHSGKVKHFAEQILKNPLRLDVDKPSDNALHVSQIAYLTDRSKKMEMLPFLIGSRNDAATLVFTSMRADADAIAKELELSGLKCAVIHGEKKHGARHKALEQFKEGKVRVLVATDIAARGLDISELACVINYNMPQSKEDYIHRIGRTGRAGARGTAISLLSVDEDAMFKTIERLLGRKIERRELEGYEREIVHVKMDKELAKNEETKRVKGAFGKKMHKAPAKKKKVTKRDFRYGKAGE